METISTDEQRPAMSAHAGFMPQDLDDLRMAKTRLESPSFAIQVADLIGHPFEAAMTMLPAPVHSLTNRLAYAALMHGMNIAVVTLPSSTAGASRNGLHRWLSAGTGALGGLAGFWSLALELPVSTTLMLRSIADIANAEGHDLRDAETRLACIQVFALGGPSPKDNAADSSYWVVRAGMSKAFTEAAAHVAAGGLGRKAGPPVARFVGAVAARFSADASVHLAARMIPLVSAASAATVNVVFTRHFQEMARGHFTVRRLEAKYGRDAVEQQYALIATGQ